MDRETNKLIPNRELTDRPWDLRSLASLVEARGFGMTIHGRRAGFRNGYLVYFFLVDKRFVSSDTPHKASEQF